MERNNLERTELGQQEFEAPLSRIDQVEEILTRNFDDIGIDLETLARQTYDSLCEDVEGGFLTLDEANELYNEWRTTWFS
jgi:hypothetical protein